MTSKKKTEEDPRPSPDRRRRGMLNGAARGETAGGPLQRRKGRFPRPESATSYQPESLLVRNWQSVTRTGETREQKSTVIAKGQKRGSRTRMRRGFSGQAGYRIWLAGRLALPRRVKLTLTSFLVPERCIYHPFSIADWPRHMIKATERRTRCQGVPRHSSQMRARLC